MFDIAWVTLKLSEYEIRTLLCLSECLLKALRLLPSFRSTSSALLAAVFATAQPSPQSQYSWWLIKSKISVSEKAASHLGWAVAFLSLIFTVLALSPAFKSQTAAQKALTLAE
jgi:hypothetical protein